MPSGSGSWRPASRELRRANAILRSASVVFRGGARPPVPLICEYIDSHKGGAAGPVPVLPGPDTVRHQDRPEHHLRGQVPSPIGKE